MRCKRPFCPEHMPLKERRCTSCEIEFRRRRRASDYTAAGLYAVAVGVAGAAAMYLGHRWGLLVVVPALAAAPLVALVTGTRAARRKFLAERLPARLPRATARSIRPPERSQ